jgi:hypothetical protein
MMIGPQVLEVARDTIYTLALVSSPLMLVDLDCSGTSAR